MTLTSCCQNSKAQIPSLHGLWGQILAIGSLGLYEKAACGKNVSFQMS